MSLYQILDALKFNTGPFSSLWMRVKFRDFFWKKPRKMIIFSGTSYFVLLQANDNGFWMREGKIGGCEMAILQKVDEETMEKYSTSWKS